MHQLYIWLSLPMFSGAMKFEKVLRFKVHESSWELQVHEWDVDFNEFVEIHKHWSSQKKSKYMSKSYFKMMNKIQQRS